MVTSEQRFTKIAERNFVILVGVLFLLLTFIVIKPILAVLLYSAILSYFLFPLYSFYLNKFGKNKIASLMTLTTATLGIFLPLALLSYFLILSLVKIVVKYKIYLENPEILNQAVSNFLQSATSSEVLASFDYSSLVTSFAKFIINYVEGFFSSIPQALMFFFIILFISYYILIYNKKIFKTFNEYIPLGLRKQNEILNNITKNLRVLFRGYFLTGIIQTVVALLGYIVFGVPNIMILTFLTLLVSLIPYLGTPLIWVPAGFYLIVTGNEFAGIGLLVYGALIISMVDNFVRPILMSDKDTISPPLVFIGFIGGLLAFGLQGLILGPIIISITAILMRYMKEFYELKI